MIAPLKVSSNHSATSFLTAQVIRRGQVEPRATFRALSYFAEEVLFSVFRAESGTHMFLAPLVWRTRRYGAMAFSCGCLKPQLGQRGRLAQLCLQGLASLLLQVPFLRPSWVFSLPTRGSRYTRL
jgi:hypothetical protein